MEHIRPSSEVQRQIDLAVARRAGGGGAAPASSVSSASVGHELSDAASPGEEPSQSSHSGDGGDDDGDRRPKYEYLDHTADVQLHGWGGTLAEALSNVAVAMFGYMTDLGSVDVDHDGASVEFGRDVVASGHDLDSLVYAFLDEWLFNFHVNGFVAKAVRVVELDRERYFIRSEGDGEVYDLEKHTQGTEVKAITYSNMQVREADGRCDIYVIVDI